MTGEDKALTTGRFTPWNHPLLGRPPGRMGRLGRVPGHLPRLPGHLAGPAARGRKQPFVRDVEAAIAGDPALLEGPILGPVRPRLRQAAPPQRSSRPGAMPRIRSRPASACWWSTAHPSEPDYLAVFPVGNDDLPAGLDDARLKMTIPALKKVAIIASVSEPATAPRRASLRHVR